MMKNVLILLLTGFSFSTYLHSQEVAIKTNLLYGGYTLTPNIGTEIALGKRSSIDLSAGYNPWNLNGSSSSNKKLVHWLANAEYRYWICQPMYGHFFGVNMLGSQYNIAGYKLPLLFGKNSKDYRHEGYAIGAGFSYGYQFLLSKHWNIELNVGIGYAYLNYSRFNCVKCGSFIDKKHKNYVGPTKAGISIGYIIK